MGRQKSEEEKRQQFKVKKLKFRKIKTWVLLLILLPLLFVDATLLRLNHIRMAELRSAVIEADANDDDEAVNRALEELREFTFSNIVINVVEENGAQRVSFGTGPFYLEHRYIRAASQALEEAKAVLSDDANPNGNIYKAASSVCEPLAKQYGWDWYYSEYINCMMGELQKYPAAENLDDQVTVALPSTELFRVNYASPLWTPTPAGFCLLITALIIVTLIVRMVVWVVLRISLLFF